MTRLSLAAREAAEDAAPFWWAYLGTGIAWILASLVILRFEYSSLTAISYLLGAVALFFGVNEFMKVGGATGGWKPFHGAIGVFYLGIGAFALIHPYDTFKTLATVMSFFLIVAGIFDIVLAFATKGESDFWWMTLIAGIVDLLLGFWAAGFFGHSAFLLVVWAAAVCLSRGVSEIVFAFKLHGLNQRLAPT